MSDETYLNKILKGKKWDSIQNRFNSDSDTLTKQIFYKNKYYQCEINKNICIRIYECK